jgi:hypothetical protein
VINAGCGKLPGNQTPLLLCCGQVVLETASGRLTQMTLSTHEVAGSNIHDIHKGSLEQALSKQLKLHRLVNGHQIVVYSLTLEIAPSKDRFSSALICVMVHVLVKKGCRKPCINIVFNRTEPLMPFLNDMSQTL